MLQPFYNKDIFPHCAPFSPFHDFHRWFKKDLLSIHPIFCCFSGSQQEQSKHRHPDLPFPGHLLQLFGEDTEALLKPKPRDIICPTYRGPPHSRICPKHLNWLLSVRRTSPSSLSPLVSWMIETRAPHSIAKLCSRLVNKTDMYVTQTWWLPLPEFGSGRGFLLLKGVFLSPCCQLLAREELSCGGCSLLKPYNIKHRAAIAII